MESSEVTVIKPIRRGGAIRGKLNVIYQKGRNHKWSMKFTLSEEEKPSVVNEIKFMRRSKAIRFYIPEEAEPSEVSEL